jgi:hypothetical protein
MVGRRGQCKLEGGWGAYLETVEDGLDLFEDGRGYDDAEVVSWKAVGL